ncbi:MAG: YbaB/EbfC family nucleoid-associated protein [Planctomycetota bacterium]|nr:MAG: YbaB/EbfC family nucleoid-associated protein [Planctomycetota bacterium]REJ98578.1 MAG: YbaB/EbfC family nucleoid-associated protein [Planctomycetota bacterium]REK29878.1 MAG: YbaB/EbfC family nucleoid-associated protein [Planctomycetota bacterium]REK47952.1 MAG: YbaB/EbfC family nucleoid-associated protein [Planctomycetota bacterium]
MLKGLANFGAILRQAQQMGSKMQELNTKLKAVRATGAAGGGLVSAEVNGLGELLSVTIEPSLIEKGDRELIEDLIPAAVAQAQTKAKEKHAEAMQELTGGMNIPGLEEALGSLTEGGSTTSS